MCLFTSLSLFFFLYLPSNYKLHEGKDHVSFVSAAFVAQNPVWRQMPLLQQVRSPSLSWLFSQSRQESYRTLSQAPGIILPKWQEQGKSVTVIASLGAQALSSEVSLWWHGIPGSLFSPVHDSRNQLALLCSLTDSERTSQEQWKGFPGGSVCLQWGRPGFNP